MYFVVILSFEFGCYIWLFAGCLSVLLFGGCFFWVICCILVCFGFEVPWLCGYFSVLGVWDFAFRLWWLLVGLLFAVWSFGFGVGIRPNFGVFRDSLWVICFWVCVCLCLGFKDCVLLWLFSFVLSLVWLVRGFVGLLFGYFVVV